MLCPVRRSKQRTEDAQDEGRWTGAGTKSEVIKTAIYHFEAKVISRGAGRSAVAAAAYQSGEQLYNDYDGITHDYTKKTGVLFSEILLPDMAPAEWADRQTLWNAVEQAEKAKDSRLARQLIVALPTELTMQDWQAMLHQFVLEECVAKGMCADFAIHDTDGHNPHAHIMLTVRPLDANGKWQAETQKEYLCRRGEEKGFTAAEFRQAQSEGWEKLYKYRNESGVTGWFTPSEAALHPTWERTSKQPKATKFGRQNPICEAWNSEVQLLEWRERWAEYINRALEQQQRSERVTHLSHAALGLSEQPTVHEGYHARNLEKQGMIADRCELNRQIRADNKLLRELKSTLQKLTKAAEYSISRIAQALETLRDKIIVAEYQLIRNHRRTRDYQETRDKITPVLRDIHAVEQQIKDKSAERKNMLAEKKACGILHPIRLHQLSGQIAALTEEIEELRDKKSMLLASLNCHSDSEAHNIKKRLEIVEQNLTKLTEQHEKLTAMRDESVAEFEAAHAEICPEDIDSVKNIRIDIRREHTRTLSAKLRETFGSDYDYRAMMSAERKADTVIGETTDSISDKAMRREYERRYPQRKSNRQKQKHNHDFDMSR
nr:MobQ family relaxase [Gemmiger formicilis]